MATIKSYRTHIIANALRNGRCIVQGDSFVGGGLGAIGILTRYWHQLVECGLFGEITAINAHTSFNSNNPSPVSSRLDRAGKAWQSTDADVGTNGWLIGGDSVRYGLPINIRQALFAISGDATHAIFGSYGVIHDTAIEPVRVTGQARIHYGSGKNWKMRQLYYWPITEANRWTRDVLVHDGKPTSTATKQHSAAGYNWAQTLNFGTAARKFVCEGETVGDARAPIAGQINALNYDFLVQYTASNLYGRANGGYSIWFVDDTLKDTNDTSTSYIDPEIYYTDAGQVCYAVDGDGEWVPGVYLQEMGVNSGGVATYGSNATPATGTTKTFLTDSLTHWLDVTTVDPNQQPLFIMILDSEIGTAQATLETYITNWRTQTRIACAAAGLPEPLFLFVHAHGQISNADPGLAIMEAALTVAATVDDMAVASVLRMTGGIVLDGGAASDAWLAAHGYASFTQGRYSAINLATKTSLLDGFQMHPADGEACAFFADSAIRAIRAGCSPGV